MSQSLYVTLDELRSMELCKPSYRKLLANIEYDDAEEVRIPVWLVCDILGVADAYWLWQRLYWRGLIFETALEMFSSIVGTPPAWIPGCACVTCTPINSMPTPPELIKFLRAQKRP